MPCADGAAREADLLSQLRKQKQMMMIPWLDCDYDGCDDCVVFEVGEYC